MSLTFASAFSGIGGFDLGFERAGMVPLWQSEIDEAASKVLAHHWPEVPNLGDITRIRVRLEADGRAGGVDAAVRGARTDGDEQPRAGRADVLCGGFPCQDLSVAGRRKGLAGERSGLFFEFARLADELRPAWLVIENVPGLLSSNSGRDFAVVLRTLADLGYQDLSWRVVDSLNLGVPQRRRRVLVVGRLGAGAATREVLLESEGRGWRAPQGGQAGPGAAATLTAGSRGARGASRPGRRQEDDVNLVAARGAVGALSASGVGTCGADDNQAQAGHLIASAITAREGKGPSSDADSGNIVVASTLTASAGHHGYSGPRGDGSDNLVPVGFNARQDPIHSEHHSGPLDVDGYSQAVAFHENHRGELTETPQTQALAGAGGKPGQGYPAARVGARVRRLTPTECERLQGFPDGWTAPAGSDSARYRCLGNAVTVNVAEWLGGRIVAYESSSGEAAA